MNNKEHLESVLFTSVLEAALQSFCIVAVITSSQLGIYFWGDFILFKGFRSDVLGIGIEDWPLHASVDFIYAFFVLILAQIIKVLASANTKYSKCILQIGFSINLFLILWAITPFLPNKDYWEPMPSFVLGANLTIIFTSIVSILRFRSMPL